MKILLRLISLFIIISVVYFATANLAPSLSLIVVNKTVNVKFTYVDIATLVAGLIAGIAWVWSYYVSSSVKLKEYQRKLEKTSVNAESDSSKVSVLEAKIQVLEKALASALEKNKE